MMWELLLVMLERLGIIVTIAFIMTRFRFVRNVIDHKDVSMIQRINFILIFGFFGIVGTYTGLAIDTEIGVYNRWTLTLQDHEAIANSRVIGIVIAGLLGGWKVGVGAGIIAGFHRWTLGGFTSIACGISTVVAGIIAGYFFKRNQNQRMISWQTALFVGILAETVQMLIILGIARPFSQAWVLVSGIGIPMMIANGVGAALFILIIRNVIHEEERMGMLQAQRALRIVDQTLQHLRKGLTSQSAYLTCSILLKEIDVAAVSITNRKEVLAYVGIDEEKYIDDKEIKTLATKEVLRTGSLKLANEADFIHIGSSFPLGSAIITPLKQNNQTIGTLKFYFRTEKERSETTIELSKGLATLLSHQLELAEIDRHLELAKQAEIKALQAQVHPHFLFNALNTIVSLIRTDPSKARQLLLSLSRFFRQNLAGINKLEASLVEELQHIQAYLSIEETRFSNRLKVVYEIEEEALQVAVPPLTLQPIVENAMKHGLKDHIGECKLLISIKKSKKGVLIQICDNGIGISSERQQQLFVSSVKSKTGTGIGLYNVKKRLDIMYGEHYKLNISSVEHTETVCSLHLFTKVEVEENEISYSNANS